MDELDAFADTTDEVEEENQKSEDVERVVSDDELDNWDIDESSVIVLKQDDSFNQQLSNAEHYAKHPICFVDTVNVY
jgi:hypothetical protein